MATPHRILNKLLKLIYKLIARICNIECFDITLEYICFGGVPDRRCYIVPFVCTCHRESIKLFLFEEHFQNGGQHNLLLVLQTSKCFGCIPCPRKHTSRYRDSCFASGTDWAIPFWKKLHNGRQNNLFQLF